MLSHRLASLSSLQLSRIMIFVIIVSNSTSRASVLWGLLLILQWIVCGSLHAPPGCSLPLGLRWTTYLPQGQMLLTFHLIGWDSCVCTMMPAEDGDLSGSWLSWMGRGSCWCCVVVRSNLPPATSWTIFVYFGLMILWFRFCTFIDWCLYLSLSPTLSAWRVVM